MNKINVPEGMETSVFIMSAGAIKDVSELLKEYFPGKRPWLIADDNTWKAAGKILQPLLENPYEPYIFPGSPILHPNSEYADYLASVMPENCVPLAVGAGVINDLVKRASGIAMTKYCCVPTAASVDGYTAYGAALSERGRKKTMPCPAPYAIAADLDVLTAAPPEMLAAGYADLVTKVPAGADWIIADAMGIEPIAPDIWQLVQGSLRKWIADCSNLENIFNGLAATGYAMQIYRESRPASGAEHLFSHVWEMEGLTCHGKDVSHGYKVAVGTLTSVLLMEYVIETDAEDAERLAEPGCSVEERIREIAKLTVRGCYGDDVERVAMAKFIPPELQAERRRLIWSIWDDLRERLKSQLLPYQEIKELFIQAKCPVTPAQIGLDCEQFLHGIKTAQLIRNRYTILDLLYEAGLLNQAMKNLGKI